MSAFVTGHHIQQNLDVSSSTLRRWANEGKVKHAIATSGVRRYDIDDVAKMCGVPAFHDARHQKEKIIYARVSSEHQRPDLQRQIQYLTERYPTYRVIQDVGSGIN